MGVRPPDSSLAQHKNKDEGKDKDKDKGPPNRKPADDSMNDLIDGEPIENDAAVIGVRDFLGSNKGTPRFAELISKKTLERECRTTTESSEDEHVVKSNTEPVQEKTTEPSSKPDVETSEVVGEKTIEGDEAKETDENNF